MQKKYSAQTKSFVILFTLIVIGVYISTVISRSKPLSENQASFSQQIRQQENSPATKTAQANQEADNLEPFIDTSNWITYQDPKYPISFKYNPNWQIKSPATKFGYYLVEVDPGKKYDNFKLYISDKNYFAMNGLPATENKIDGFTALSVVDMLYGIKKSGLFYTFDLGASMSLKPQFKALVSTVAIAD